MKLVYIVGSGHCGSTLVDIVLGAHSKVFGAGELYNLKFENKCSCLKIIKDCKQWSGLKEKININFLKIFRTKKNFLLDKENFIYLKNKKPVDKNLYLSDYKLILNNIIKNNPELDVIVDSSKDVDKLEFLLKYSDLDIYIVHIVRDGRAVSWSYIRKYKKLFPYIFKWFLTNFKIELLRRRYNKKFIFLRYEDFIKNSEASVSQILDLLNLKFEKDMLDLSKLEKHQVEGNRLRFNKELSLKKDESWVEDMPFKYKILFNLLFGWFNLFYKYRK